MASIREVAAEAKVSPGTVSKVLNERGNASISRATQARVREAAERIGYHPSSIARGLAGMRMNAIGVVMAYDEESLTSDPYLGPCLDGLLSIYKQERQKVTLFLEQNWDAALQNIPFYGDGHCDGLALIIPRTTHPIVDTLRSQRPHLPFVLVGDSREGEGLTCIDLDNVSAGRMATEHLISLGHRRIAAFQGNADFCSNDQRFKGYRDALASAGLPYDPEIVYPGVYFAESGVENVRRMQKQFTGDNRSGRPSAIFCFSDSIAFGALEALRKYDIHMPTEISVIGIDDLTTTAQQRGLTTIRQSVRSIGQRAAIALLGLARGEITPGFRDLQLPELVLRSSTVALQQ